MYKPDGVLGLALEDGDKEGEAELDGDSDGDTLELGESDGEAEADALEPAARISTAHCTAFWPDELHVQPIVVAVLTGPVVWLATRSPLELTACCERCVWPAVILLSLLE